MAAQNNTKTKSTNAGKDNVNWVSDSDYRNGRFYLHCNIV